MEMGGGLAQDHGVLISFDIEHGMWEDIIARTGCEVGDKLIKIDILSPPSSPPAPVDAAARTRSLYLHVTLSMARATIGRIVWALLLGRCLNRRESGVTAYSRPPGVGVAYY